MGARTSSSTGSSFDTADILLPGIFLATSAGILSTPVTVQQQHRQRRFNLCLQLPGERALLDASPYVKVRLYAHVLSHFLLPLQPEQACCSNPVMIPALELCQTVAQISRKIRWNILPRIIYSQWQILVVLHGCLWKHGKSWEPVGHSVLWFKIGTVA